MKGPSQPEKFASKEWVLQKYEAEQVETEKSTGAKEAAIIQSLFDELSEAEVSAAGKERLMEIFYEEIEAVEQGKPSLLVDQGEEPIREKFRKMIEQIPSNIRQRSLAHSPLAKKIPSNKVALNKDRQPKEEDQPNLQQSLTCECGGELISKLEGVRCSVCERISPTYVNPSAAQVPTPSSKEVRFEKKRFRAREKEKKTILKRRDQYQQPEENWDFFQKLWRKGWNKEQGTKGNFAELAEFLGFLSTIALFLLFALAYVVFAIVTIPVTIILLFSWWWLHDDKKISIPDIPSGWEISSGHAWYWDQKGYYTHLITEAKYNSISPKTKQLTAEDQIEWGWRSEGSRAVILNEERKKEALEINN